MTNLLRETYDALRRENKTPDDVDWVGSESYGYFDWEHFEKIADVEYDSGYGSQEIASDLVVVGDDWWLERYEYDGAEGWVFKMRPARPERAAQAEHLACNSVGKVGWHKLFELNEEDPHG